MSPIIRWYPKYRPHVQTSPDILCLTISDNSYPTCLLVIHFQCLWVVALSGIFDMPLSYFPIRYSPSCPIAIQLPAFFLVIFPSPPWICPPYLLNYPLVNKHNYGKSPFLMGKLTISMAVFQFAFCMFTRPGTVDIDGKIKHAWIVEIIFRKPMDFSRFWL